ncbi:hypothetical protein Cpir12675_004051 [Ceratocystis pirilliformis]|uniref:Pru domain-containing protein n=1 Tax=Ceratocystis pirilliformis TaxID=259994 RepID=A0ABR3Z0A3_9PEZI
MSTEPLIVFRAGRCDIDTTVTPPRVTPKPDPGYLSLYNGEDADRFPELIHLCWRKRSSSSNDQPDLDLVMIPEDGNFLHYDSESPSAKTNGRIYVLKFRSSSQRYLFWLQSAPEHPTIHSRLSERDRKITDIVFNLLQGEEVDVDAELAALDEDDDEEEEEEEYEDEDEDEDEEMADQTTTARGTTGGAGADATGGDIRDEGEDAREGGADGGRAATETTANVDSVVRNLLASLEGSRQLSDSPHRLGPNDKPFPFLSHLLPTSVTVPIIDSGISEEKIDQLINLLPPTLVVVTANNGTNSAEISQDPTAEMLESAMASLSLADKRDLVKRVLRSPQFSQSLGSLTMAIRDGGLPTIAEALQIDVENNGYMRGSAMPLGNGKAVEAFVEGVRKTVSKKE